jgi:nicotinate-nucleotide adenylyltransferase
MSEKRDLWVPVVLALAGLSLAAWNVAEARWALAAYALLVGLVGALACLPLRLKRGQARVVGFGAGVALLLCAAAPGVAGGAASFFPWLVGGAAFLLPLRRLGARIRVLLLGVAGLLAVLGALTLLGPLPGALTWLFLSGAFLAAAAVFDSRPRPEPPPPPGPRIAFFGGTFDPFHRGHRVLAEAALRVVDRLLVVPTGQPPHKQDRPEPTPFHHRMAMARLGVEGLARVEVSGVEGRRAGPSYTVDTLEVVRASLPPEARLLVLLGADMLQDFPHWRSWEVIAEQAVLLVARRPGYAVDPPVELVQRGVRIESLEAPLVDVAASQLRETLAAGRSPGDLVQPSVQAYIRDHALYAAE